jgi:hypothetical protein
MIQDRHSGLSIAPWTERVMGWRSGMPVVTLVDVIPVSGLRVDAGRGILAGVSEGGHAGSGST